MFKRLSAANWITVAFTFLVLVSWVVSFVMHAVLVTRKSEANLVPYLVDVITIPKYVIILDLAAAIWFMFAGKRNLTYWLLLVYPVLLFANGLFGLGKWYQEANYANQFEFHLLDLAALGVYAGFFILTPICLLGLAHERRKKRERASN